MTDLIIESYEEGDALQFTLGRLVLYLDPLPAGGYVVRGQSHHFTSLYQAITYLRNRFPGIDYSLQ